jgi:peptide/nickel transport system substrate-binding protein
LTSPGAYFALLGLNTQLGPLKDVHVRRAIAYAINVEGMINALYAGHATEIVTPLPTDVDANLGSSSEVNAMLSSLPNYKFDLAAAKRELAKSAYPHGFTTSIELSAGGADGVVAQIIAADLAKIGITMKVDELQSSTLFGDLAAGTLTNELVVGYYPVYNDPQSILAELLLTKEIGPKGPGYNFAKYESPEVDNLLTKETESTTPQERLQVLGKALRIVASEAPYRPLFTYDAFEALSEKYVFPTFSPWTILFTPWALDVKLAK